MEALIEYLRAERGRAAKLASDLGITQAAINQWDKVPAERIVDISRATGIPKDLLRPDIFGDYTPAPSAVSSASPGAA